MQIQLIVILHFLIKMVGNVTINFKVSVDTLLLHEHYHEVIHIVCESIYMTFIISSFTEQLLCDFYVCNIYLWNSVFCQVVCMLCCCRDKWHDLCVSIFLSHKSCVSELDLYSACTCVKIVILLSCCMMVGIELRIY